MTVADNQHLAWLARSFGRPDYVPLSPADLSLLERVATPVSRYPGTHLFREGEPADAAYLVERGDVDLYRTLGGRRRVITRVGPGSVIGDVAMFGEGTYLSSARAATPVKAFRFERSRLLPELVRYPAVCLRWLVAGLRQLERTQRRIIHLMHKTVLAQVADLLAEEAAQRPEVLLSQATIATLLGTTRQSVNEALATLRGMGLVETGYRRIKVLDRDGLMQVAGN